MKQHEPSMATNPRNSDISDLPKTETQPSSSSTNEQQICLSFDEAITKLPAFLQPDNESERNELAMFVSEVDQLHKPIIGKVSARSVFNYLQNLLKPTTHSIEEVSQVTFPEQLPQLTENIATEIASSVIGGADLKGTTISVLNVLQEFSWETKAILMVTTFVLTFGDNGLNFSEETKASVNDIQLFAKPRGGSNKHQLEDNNNLFIVVFQLIGSIIEFERLPTTYMTSNDQKVKIKRTELIVVVYWIVRIIIAGATSHLLKFSRRGYEFDRTIVTLWELSSRWCKKLEHLHDSNHLKETLVHLQDLLEKDVDIEAYNKIKKIIQFENHNDNMEVLNVLTSSANEDVPVLYDCLRKRKVHMNELKGEYVLLFISGIENITPEVDETKLNDFMNSFDPEKGNHIECNIVWIPIVDRSVQRVDATQISMLKPFVDWLSLIHYTDVLLYDRKRMFKGCYSICDSSVISNEVKKFIRDDWKYKDEPIIVVLNSEGNVVHLNAIHMFYLHGFDAFPFSNDQEEKMLANYRWFSGIMRPLTRGLGELYNNWTKNDDECILWYGGGDMEWIRSVTGLVPGIARELGKTIDMVYVGEMMMSLDDEEVARSVKEEKLCRHHCISDPILLFLFWNRLHSLVYSSVNAGDATDLWVQDAQRWLNYDKSYAGWANLQFARSYHSSTKHEKVVLSTLKEFNMWKEDAKNNYRGFTGAFDEYSEKVHKRIFGEYYSIEFPSAALIKDQPPIHPECKECGRKMKEYTTLVCYHGRGRGRGRGRGGTTTNN